MGRQEWGFDMQPTIGDYAISALRIIGILIIIGALFWAGYQSVFVVPVIMITAICIYGVHSLASERARRRAVREQSGGMT